MSSVQPVILGDRHPEDLEIYERLAKLQEIYAQVRVNVPSRWEIAYNMNMLIIHRSLSSAHFFQTD
jgi:hypothetical protein